MQFMSHRNTFYSLSWRYW